MFQYYAESHAVIYIVDSSDKERIDESKEAFGWFLQNILDACSILNDIFISLQTKFVRVCRNHPVRLFIFLVRAISPE